MTDPESAATRGLPESMHGKEEPHPLLVILLNPGAPLTEEELAEVRRMLKCTPQYPNERVALSAVGKLLVHYIRGTQVIESAPARASQEPSQ